MNFNDKQYEHEHEEHEDQEDQEDQEEEQLEEIESVDEDTLKLVYNSLLNKKSFFDDSDDDTITISNKKNKKSNDNKNKKMSLSDFLKSSEKDKPKKFVSKRVENKNVQLTENTSVRRYFNPRKSPFNLVNNNKNRNIVDTHNELSFPKLGK